MFEELEDQVAKSAAADREKEENKKREREVTKERVEDAIRRAKEEGEELEVLRKRRELSVPHELEDNEECSVVCVRHTVLGTVTQKFKKDSTMNRLGWFHKFDTKILQPLSFA